MLFNSLETAQKLQADLADSQKRRDQLEEKWRSCNADAEVYVKVLSLKYGTHHYSQAIGAEISTLKSTVQKAQDISAHLASLKRELHSLKEEKLRAGLRCLVFIICFIHSNARLSDIVAEAVSAEFDDDDDTLKSALRDYGDRLRQRKNLLGSTQRELMHAESAEQELQQQ